MGNGCTRVCPECTQEIRRPDGRVMATERARGASERRQRRIASGVIVLAALSAAVMLLRLFS